MFVFLWFPNSHASDSASGQDKDPMVLNLGFDTHILDDVDITDVRAAIDVWLSILAKRMGVPAKGYMFPDFDSLMEEIREGMLDFGTTTTLDYLRIRKKNDVELLFGASRGGKETQKYLLLVRSDSSVTSIEDLKGETLLIRQNDEIGMVFLDTLLMKRGFRKASGFFSSIVEKKKTARAILSLFFGKGSACLAKDADYNIMKELNPQIGKRLKVITCSPDFVTNMAFIRADLSDWKKKLYQRAMIELQNSVAVSQILHLFKSDKVFNLKERHLETMKTLLEEYRMLNAEGSS